MASLKRKAEDGDDKPNSKKTKLSNSSANITTTGTRSTAENFFHDLVVFIFPAGIQKARLQLFKSQVEKFGGSLKNSLTNDVTHIIVDEAMTIQRMCKIMKTDTPPSDKTIVKSAWLSACFRQKDIVSTTDFQLAIPCSASSDSGDVGNSQKSNTGTESRTGKTEIDKEPAPSSSEHHHFPKVGVMWNAFKSRPKGEESDSDYVPSDDEGFDSGRVTMNDTASTSSTDTTPNMSPEKNVPVSYF